MLPHPRVEPPVGTRNESQHSNTMAKQQIQVKLVGRKSRPAPVRQKSREKQEITAVGRALRAVGGLGGAYAGGLFGQPAVGSTIGTGLGAQLSKWLGMGDYTVSENSIVRQGASGVVPSMHKNGQTVIVRHKEFITEVTGKTAFTVQRSFSINPGLVQTFPWLSGVAAQYSEYRIRGMVYHYVPTSGNAVSSTNAALGSVMLQTSYRANEAAPTSKVEMLNEYWASESKPSEAFCHPIECDPRENPFNVQYIRTGGVPANDNILLYDLGTTRLAVSGQQANDIVLGDLWCTYEIELRKPKLTDLVGESLPSFKATSTTSINTTTPFGTNATTFIDTTSGTTLSSTAITLAPGNVGTYQLTVFYTGATAVDNDGGAFVGCTAVSVYAGNYTAPGNPATATSGYVVATTFQVTNPNTTATYTPQFATLTNATAMTAVLSKINPALIG